MSAAPLCKLPPDPPPGCCQSPPPPPAAPLTIDNPPGLLSVSYRIGTFTSFRRAMLDEVNLTKLMGPDPNSPLASPPAFLANPFAGWREGTNSDYQTAFIELWSYLADILTFYQERIANEAFLGTATQRDSLLRLAALIDYQAGPGSGASALVAFTVAKNKVVSVPTGFRVGTRAKPPVPAAVFETAAAITALAEHSSIPLSAVAPTNQFAPITSFGSIFTSGFGDVLQRGIAAESIYGSFGAILLDTLSTPLFTRSSRQEALQFSKSTPQITVSAAPQQAVFLASAIKPAFIYRPFSDTTTRTIILKGANNRLKAGDFVVAVENEDESGENGTAHEIITVTSDQVADTTTIAWREDVNIQYDQRKKPVTILALRVTASPSGSTAPQWQSLPPSLTDSDGLNPSAPYKDQNWDISSNPKFFLSGGSQIFLDGVYDKATPGWMVLNTDDVPPLAFRVTESRPVSHVDYATTSKVTRLILSSGKSIAAATYPFRTTVVLAGSEELQLQNNLPLPDPVQGDSIILAGLYPKLVAGQSVILSGQLFDPVAQAPIDVTSAESRVLAATPVRDTDNNITTVKLDKPLTNQYTRAGMVLMANIANVTQGETVKDETLGSGSGGVLQSYPLKQKPVTYLPSTDPEGIAAVESTLQVTVNQVLWKERPNLLSSAPDSQEYKTTLDETGQTTVIFGDGVNGACPPTGVNNVRARYRKGLGVSGNAASAGIAQLVDSAAGLQSVTNPLPATGGADQESLDRIRVNAPSSVRTFGRAVSSPDYAAIALSYPGVAKATASLVRRDANLKAIPQPFLQLTIATSDGVPLSQQPEFKGKLRSFLDQRRDPNVPLRIVDFTPVFVDVAIDVEIDDRSPHQATLSNVLAALNPGLNSDGTSGYFGFANLNFGESLHLSAIYAAVQSVPGVSDALITTFRRMDLDAADTTVVRDDIFIRPTEIAVIGNDPKQPSQGLLQIDAKGGFVDT